jgi:hypothetical protein
MMDRNPRFDNARVATSLSKTRGRRKGVTTVPSAPFSRAGMVARGRSMQLASL